MHRRPASWLRWWIAICGLACCAPATLAQNRATLEGPVETVDGPPVFWLVPHSPEVVWPYARPTFGDAIAVGPVDESPEVTTYRTIDWTPLAAVPMRAPLPTGAELASWMLRFDTPVAAPEPLVPGPLPSIEDQFQTMPRTWAFVGQTIDPQYANFRRALQYKYAAPATPSPTTAARVWMHDTLSWPLRRLSQPFQWQTVNSVGYSPYYR